MKEPVSRLLREDLGQSLQLRLVSGRSRRVGGNQRHCGDAVVGGKPDDIGYALFPVFRDRRIVGRIRHLMVAVDFAEEIVNDRLIRLQLGRPPARGHVGRHAGVESTFHGRRIMGVPDIIAAPIARGYEDGEFDQAWLHSGSPAHASGG